MIDIIEGLKTKVNQFNQFIIQQQSLLIKRAAFYAYLEIKYNHQKISQDRLAKAYECINTFISYNKSYQFIYKSNNYLKPILNSQVKYKLNSSTYEECSEVYLEILNAFKCYSYCIDYLKNYHFQKNPETTSDLIFENFQSKVDFEFNDLFEQQDQEQYCSAKTDIDILEEQEDYKAQLEYSQNVFIEYFAIVDSDSYKLFKDCYYTLESAESHNPQIDSFLNSFKHLSDEIDNLSNSEVSMNHCIFSSMQELLETTCSANMAISLYQSIIINHNSILSFTHNQNDAFKQKPF